MSQNIIAVRNLSSHLISSKDPGLKGTIKHFLTDKKSLKVIKI